MSGKILIVDDNPNALKLVGYALDREGFEIGVARSGPEALEKAEAEMPDLIILDIMMPDMDGYEVCRRLRAMHQTERTPIIMLTARGRAEDRVMGFQAGADDYVTKPVLPAELIARVRALLARARLETETAPARARVIGFLGVKGGVGTTTLAVNVTLTLRQEVDGKKSVILADFHTWGGAVAHHLSLFPRDSLATLLEKPSGKITRNLVESCLASHGSDIRVLVAAHDVERGVADLTPDHADAIMEQLKRMADYVLLDLGSGLCPATQAALKHCNYIVVPIEPDPVALSLAQTLLVGLSNMDIYGGQVGFVLVNRTRSATTYTRSAIEDLLQNHLIAVITPAPELFFHAAKTGVPVVASQPDGLTATQFRELARLLVG
jgi:CheY-like chemotaxis protein/MinD-like ATPase involved in chromosome partitioning or flagellar assembly